MYEVCYRQKKKGETERNEVTEPSMPNEKYLQNEERLTGICLLRWFSYDTCRCQLVSKLQIVRGSRLHSLGLSKSGNAADDDSIRQFACLCPKFKTKEVSISPTGLRDFSLIRDESIK